jgi:hypothetical protein
MSTRPAASDVRENGLGNLEMTALAESLHFHHIGLEMTSNSLVEITETAISNVHHFHPLRGTSLPWTWSAGQAVGARASAVMSSLCCNSE